MWIINKKEQRAIDLVKASRPSCLERLVRHVFVDYWSENRRTCVDCGYTEKQIIK